MSSVRRLALALALAALAGGQAGPALAADSATVDVDVTVATPCIITTTPSISFGTLPFTPVAYSDAGVSTTPIGFESCASVDESLFAHGTDATGGATTWPLSRDGVPCLNPTPGLYKLTLSSTTQPAVSLGLTTTDQELETVAAGSTGAANRLRIQMPCAGADGAGQTMTMQIVITATF